MSVVNDVPDDTLLVGSHWRTEAGSRDANQKTRWRMNDAFIKATKLGGKVAVTSNKAWGGTSDSKYFKSRCYFSKEMGYEDDFKLPKAERKKRNIKRAEYISTMKEEIQ